MGRNWHKTEDYVFTDSSGRQGSGTGGMLVVKPRPTIENPDPAPLVACFNDSFHEVILEAYHAGERKGFAKGDAHARREIRHTLGLD